MRIFLDAMGGDYAPQSTVEGALMALKQFPTLHIELGGDIEAIEKVLERKSYDSSRLSLVACSEIIDNNESPVMAIRTKKDSPIVKGMLLLKEKKVDAFVSAGSTGAVLAGGMFRLGRLPGVDRPALAPLMPHGNGFFLLIDCGANVDCKPRQLLQFAHMGKAYMEGVMNVNSPRIGLVNIGAEEEKGDELRKETYQLLKTSSLNFVGNIEARYITSNQADVIVCDGFTGNIILKFMEGLSKKILTMVKSSLMLNVRTKLGALLAKPAFLQLKKKFDYKEVGGAPMLGVLGSVIKAHGSSDGYAIFSSIKQAIKMVEENVPQRIQNSLNFKEDNNDNI